MSTARDRQQRGINDKAARFSLYNYWPAEDLPSASRWKFPRNFAADEVLVARRVSLTCPARGILKVWKRGYHAKR